MEAKTIEDILKYFDEYNISYEYVNDTPGEFNREISFTIENRTYYILWWVNQCYLQLDSGFSKPKLPFKYINVNSYLPTTLHKLNLCFYDVKTAKTGNEFIYNEIPFGSFKIPFNK